MFLFHYHLLLVSFGSPTPFISNINLFTAYTTYIYLFIDLTVLVATFYFCFQLWNGTFLLTCFLINTDTRSALVTDLSTPSNANLQPSTAQTGSPDVKLWCVPRHGDYALPTVVGPPWWRPQHEIKIGYAHAPYLVPGLLGVGQ